MNATSALARLDLLAAAGALSDEHLAELLDRRFVKVSSYISDEMVSLTLPGAAPRRRDGERFEPSGPRWPALSARTCVLIFCRY